jgi:5-carboxymethyl-2-hydroxymuconate isomerase
MPHIHLTTTANIVAVEPINKVLKKLVDLLSDFDTIQPEAIKAYHTIREVWEMGAGAKPGFIHCEVALLTGRSQPLRQEIGIAFEKKLTDLFLGAIESDLAKITVEVREMDAETYRR